MEHKPLTLDASAIYSANNASMFEAGDSLAREAQRVCESAFSIFEPTPEWNPEQAEYAERRAEEWRLLIERAYNDQLRRRASWVPVIVAGPSNYDSRKHGKRADAQMKAGAEWAEKIGAFQENTIKRLDALTSETMQVERYRRGCSDPVSADDPAALKKLTARLDHLKEHHAHMKALNAWFKNHKTCVGCPELSEGAALELDAEIGKAFSRQSQPYPAYALTNNNANIKRIEARVRQLQSAKAKADNGTPEPERYGAFTVQHNTDLNRVQFLFDEKPSEETRALLKSHGFRWSPNAGAWQRQLNGNGLYAAKKVAQALAGKADEEKPAAPVSPRLDPERQEALSEEIRACMQLLVDSSLSIHGSVTQDTLDALEVQGYAYVRSELVRIDETITLDEFAARVAQQQPSA